MRLTPTPIIVVSASLEGREAEIAFQSMRAGALTVISKPSGMRDPKYVAMAGMLLNTVRAMAGVRVIRHWKRQETLPKPKPVQPLMPSAMSPEIVAIATSTGGPAALSEILRTLPGDFPLPIVIVQHMATDFYPSLVAWLSKLTSLRVVMAQPGEQPRPGTVYFASGEGHLRLSLHRRFEIDTNTGASAYTPSGDVLLESVAKAYGSEAVGVVLTGMGDDGARGLRAMRAAGATTIAQDEGSSVVFGMPREAIHLGGAQQVLALPDIANALLALAKATAEQ
jgi:two-component system chemotaxis response regulator CheB